MGAASPLIDIKVLRGFEPLASLPLDRLKELAAKARVVQYAAGRPVYRRGERPRHTLFLLSGQLTLRREGRRDQTVKAGSARARTAVVPAEGGVTEVVARTQASLLAVDTDLLEILLSWNDPAAYEVTEIDVVEDEGEGWLARLLQRPGYQRLPAECLQRLMSRLEEVPAKAGEAVIRQDARDDWYYIVKSGQCRVTRRPEAGAAEIELARLGPGEGFGEEALITGGTRNATVTMTEDGVLLRLSRKDFLELLVEPLVPSRDHAACAALVREGAVLLDVRSPEEHERQPVGLNVPLSVLRLKAESLDRTRRYVVCCDDGARSRAAAYLLIQLGFDVVHLAGGLAAAGAPGGAAEGAGAEVVPLAAAREARARQAADAEVRAAERTRAAEHER
ncbi:MAG TPA: cyclic nucleotide-binding domain-containing protein, partial [Chromatiales bacterium]|nr:cyclic nucleotide-binding domain-containing protein [Chromatiales bacterium]